jgi:GNAT superfamily N-acetyltransferase
MSTSGWTLRPATAQDRNFVVELNRVAIGPDLEATFGWDDDAQRAYFDDGFDARGGQIIQLDGIDVDELLLEERPAELRVVRLALLPDWRGHGIGPRSFER